MITNNSNENNNLITKDFNKKNKIAPFLLRLFSLIIDIIIFSSISISISLICIGYQNIDDILVKENISFIPINKSFLFVNSIPLFYVWLLLTLATLIIQSLVIPLLTKGRTIGDLCCNLKIWYEDNNYNQSNLIFRRFLYSGGLFVLLILLFLICIDPQLVNKILLFGYVKENPSWNIKINANIYETIRFTIPATFSTIISFIELFFVLSIVFNKDRIGILDKLTKTKVVLRNKFILVENLQKPLVPIRQEKVSLIFVE